MTGESSGWLGVVGREGYVGDGWQRIGEGN